MTLFCFELYKAYLHTKKENVWSDMSSIPRDDKVSAKDGKVEKEYTGNGTKESPDGDGGGPSALRKRSPNTFEGAIRAVDNTIGHGMKYLWQKVDSVLGRTPQKHPLEDVEDKEMVLMARSRPFLTPKQARKSCMRKCSAHREPCAC